jgi:hypothetical protein
MDLFYCRVCVDGRPPVVMQLLKHLPDLRSKTWQPQEQSDLSLWCDDK